MLLRGLRCWPLHRAGEPVCMIRLAPVIAMTVLLVLMVLPAIRAGCVEVFQEVG